ncbi:glucose/galactose transporter [Rheinheimera pacifica]|uniref:sugar MFS transporter n=1 Tax=Rheinheimera pacifica TaxID=173990 RepID=UPI002167C6D6|nr:sugar MFS transporter [Rheinheimera pacifica]MCS4307639.1 glucose/galactose transporter [Rheinheimera pacifica]
MTHPGKTGYGLQPIIIIGVLFFMFGFITWLNGALIPFLQLVCQLSEVQALLIAFSFYIAYVVMALPMARVLIWSGYKNAMSIGLGLIALGCALFIPAALSQQFAVFLLAQFVVGSGLTLLQTASNPYLVRVGPEQSAAARISLMGILNKSAGVLAPLVFTWLVLQDLGHITAESLALLDEAQRLQQLEMLSLQLITPYAGIAVAILLLAVALRFSALPDLPAEPAPVSTGKGDASVWQHRHLVLGVITLFCYVGVEVIAGDTIGLLGSALQVPGATTLTSYTLAFMVLGYSLGLLLVPRLLSQRQALAISAGLGLILSVAILLSDAQSSAIAAVLWGWAGIPLLPDPVSLVALLGLANALVWPAVWPLALAGLGSLTPKGSALLIMGIAGGAILPLVYGVLSEQTGPVSAYMVLLPCYAMILYYALHGCKRKAFK